MIKKNKESFVKNICCYAATMILHIFFLHFMYMPVFSQTVLKGGVAALVEKGQNIKISFNTPINFYFSNVGDNIVVFLQEDIVIEGKAYISKGSRVEGIISNINEPGVLGKDGSFEIEFNKIVTLDGTSIPIVASCSTDTKTVSEKVASIISYDAALVAYGGAHGLIAGLQYGGIPLAVASQGISLLAGAGAGLGAGIIGSITRKGQVPIIVNNSVTNLVLKSDLYILGELPQLANNQKKEEAENKEKEYKGFRFFPETESKDIELVINNIKKEHSKKYGDYVTLGIKIKNNSNKSISLSDIVLQSDSNKETLHADIFLTGKEALRAIKQQEEVITNLTFLVKHHIVKEYYLALIDPLDQKEILRVYLRKKS